MGFTFQSCSEVIVQMAGLELILPSDSCACMLLCCLLMHLQYGQSSFYKLPGGKLKPDEDGGWASLMMSISTGAGAGAGPGYGGTPGACLVGLVKLSSGRITCQCMQLQPSLGRACLPACLPALLAVSSLLLCVERLCCGCAEVTGLRRKLEAYLSPESELLRSPWDIAECVGSWVRPNFDTMFYPYTPPHITRPKEVKKVFVVQLPENCYFGVSPPRCMCCTGLRHGAAQHICATAYLCHTAAVQLPATCSFGTSSI
jgi:hypothetical protein